MQVNIEIERRAKALDQRHRAGLRGRGSEAGLIDQITRNRAIDNAQHRAHHMRLAGQWASARVL